MDLNINIEELKNKKYAELQKIAKTLGIKANMKAEKLVKNLTEYIRGQQKDTGFACISGKPVGLGDGDTTTNSENSDTEIEIKPKAVKPTKGRRGKRKAQTENFTDTNHADSLTMSPAKFFKSPAATLKPRLSVHTPKQASVKRTATPSSRSGVSTPHLSKPDTPRICKTPRTPVPQNRPATPVVTTPAKASATRRSNSTVRPSTKRKRSSTKTPDSGAEAEKGPSVKKQKQTNSSESGRKRTYGTTDKPSPGLKDMLGSMKDSMTDDEQRKSLAATLERRAHEKGYRSDSSSDGEKTTHIPRFTGLPAKVKKTVTPGNKDWEKLHQKHFDKMESIDDYLSNKQKRAGELMTSAKKVKELKQSMQSALDSLKKHKTPPSLKKSATAAKIEKVKSRGNLFNSPFVPSVTSTKKVNLNFGGSSMKTPQFTGRGGVAPLNKTPAEHLSTRKSPRHAGHVMASASKENLRKSVGTNRKSAATPFKFTAGMNTSLNQSTKKSNPFDLKASLSKPITWKMHSGPLKPMTVDNPYTAGSARKSVKEVRVKTKEERRRDAQKLRADRRMDNRMKRRNIVS